jgi:hypothetical protein
MFRLPLLSLLLPVVLALPLAGCEQLGIETPAQATDRQEAEGKAVGGACRHAGRALEDCYRSSPKTSKAAIYTGWRDMDAYMRENKLEIVIPAKEREAPKPVPAPEAEEEGNASPAEKTDKAAEKIREDAPLPPKGGKTKQS